MTREIATHYGLFGRIRILERMSDGALMYCLGGSIQTLMLKEGVSAFGYVHAAKLLVGDARQVLMIGAAAHSRYPGYGAHIDPWLDLVLAVIPGLAAWLAVMLTFRQWPGRSLQP